METQEQQQPKKASKAKTKIMVVIAALLILGLGGAIIWLAKGEMTPRKEKILSSLALPITLVNSQPIYSNQYFERLNLAKKLAKDGPVPDAELLKKSLLIGMTEEVKIGQLAKQVGIGVTSTQIETEFEQRDKFTQVQQGKKLADLLSEYGISESYYKNIFLTQDVLLSNLAVWFNRQKNLNEPSFQATAEIEEKLNKGEKFESLVASYSQDQASAELEGDLGFVEFSDLPPEISSELETMSVGEIRTLPSRYGLHIIKLEERDNKGENNGARIHLRQIFIGGGDFETWYKERVKDYKVKQLVKM